MPMPERVAPLDLAAIRTYCEKYSGKVASLIYTADARREFEEQAAIDLPRCLDEIERLRVQLAGCLVATEGGVTGENDCQQGDYVWSPAFEQVKKLRRERDELLHAIQRLPIPPPEIGDGPDERVGFVLTQLFDLKSVLAAPKVSKKGVSDPDRSKEYKWLQEHSLEYAGKWVAVEGDQLVAVANTLKKLLRQLRELNLAKAPTIHRPLLHHISSDWTAR